jgi:hypothetical protein
MHFVNNKTDNVRLTLRRVIKTINITYSESVSVALGIQRALRMPHIVIYGLFGCAVFLRIL